jgi:tetratricopeptide (TPR) repeat protein
MELAAFDGRYVIEAEKQYKEAVKTWETMIEQIGTYRAYMNYCTLYGRMAHLYIMKGDEEKTEFCFQKSIEIGEAFLRTNPDGQYKGILADIYMEMASYYESKDTEEAKRKEADLYLKSLRIYEEIRIAEDDYRQKSNFAAICNGLAGVSMILEQYEDAVFYYKRNIQITEEIPYEFRDSRRVICHYSSYNRMAAIAVQNGNLDLGIEYLTKAIELEDQVLYNLKNQEDLLEILEDKIKDCGFLAAIYQSQGVLEKAEHYLLKEIEALTILEKSMMDVMFTIPSDENVTQCIVTKDAVEGKKAPKVIRRRSK